MEYTAQIVIIIATAFLSSLIALMVNAGWSATKAYIASISIALKQKIVMLTVIKYFFLAAVAFAFIWFISEVKLLVSLMAVWGLLTSFFIFKDYLFFTLSLVRSLAEKEKKEKEFNHLLFQLGEEYVKPNSKRFHELMRKIKEVR